MLKDYGEVKRSAEDRIAWRAITRDDDDCKCVCMVCVWSADVAPVWTTDKIIITTALICAVAVVAAVVIVIVAWLYFTRVRKATAADPIKKESALLVPQQSNETLFDMLMDGTGSGSG